MSYTNGLDNPQLYFQTKLYVGTGSSNAITLDGSENMQPDWVWIKCRDDSHNHQVFDSVRGVHKRMRTDTTGVETSSTESLKSFDSDGFTLGTQANVNNSSNTFVSWNWKAGTSVSGTTTGSGTGKAYTGSVSTDAGFSIIGYIGNGTANHTLPHHLGVVPKMLIIKNRTSSGYEWSIYHHLLGNEKRMFLNDDSAAGSSTAYWNNTSPTSSVINLGSGGAVNENNSNMIAYCFADVQGYSKVGGSYTGNGNADGTFVYTGFSPAFVMIKLSSGSGNSWNIFDNKREGYNPDNDALFPDVSGTETTTDYLDFTASGFKIRNNSSAVNTSGATYIFAAFAAFPTVTSSGVAATAR